MVTGKLNGPGSPGHLPCLQSGFAQVPKSSHGLIEDIVSQIRAVPRIKLKMISPIATRSPKLIVTTQACPDQYWLQHGGGSILTYLKESADVEPSSCGSQPTGRKPGDQPTVTRRCEKDRRLDFGII